MPPSVLRASIRTAAIIALFAWRSLGAQCADGSRPPCRQATVAVKPVAIDASRVAVLHFRVTTADPLIGEGFAELIAQEFTGVGGPRSIEMSTRRLGAGNPCEGTIVGLRGR